MAELTGKTIGELQEDTSLTGSELFPVMDGSTTKRISLSSLRGQFMMAQTGTTLPNGTNIDDVLEPGTYVLYPGYITGGTAPPAVYGCKMFVVRGFRDTNDNGTTYIPRTWQIVYEMNPTCREYRRYYGFSGWSDWITIDQASENTRFGSIETKLEALGNGNVKVTRVTIANNNSASLAVPGLYARGVLILTSSSPLARGIYAIMTSNEGVVSAYPIVEASGITFNGGTNTVTITNGASYYAYGLFIQY